MAGRDTAVVASLMQSLARTGGYDLSQELQGGILAVLGAGRADERQTVAEIRRLHPRTSQVCDPHTAVASHVAQEYRIPGLPMITLATAHPASSVLATTAPR